MSNHDLTTVEGILSALNVNPAWPIDRRENALKLECANYNALVEISSALNCDPPSSLDRVSEIVSAVWAMKHKSVELAAVARHDNALAEELRAEFTANAASLKTANAALKRICEVVEWSAPACPQDAVDAALNRMAIGEGTIARAEQAEAHRNRLNQRLEKIGYALDDAGAPKVYNLPDDTERDIPDPERIRLLGDRVHTLRAQVREAADATNYLDALIEAHNALDAIGAPRLADGCVLSLAARIRAIPR